MDSIIDSAEGNEASHRSTFVKSRRIRLYSPFPPDECAARITAGMEQEPKRLAFPHYLFSTKPVVGQIEGASLRLRKRLSSRKSSQIFLFAEMQAEGTGTVIVCEFEEQSPMKMLKFICVGCFALIAGVAFISLLVEFLVRGSVHFDDGPWLVVLMLLAMIITRVDWFGFDAARDRKEMRGLVRFLVRTLAVENPPSDDVL